MCEVYYRQRSTVLQVLAAVAMKVLPRKRSQRGRTIELKSLFDEWNVLSGHDFSHAGSAAKPYGFSR
jgi:hypothetical protein